MTLEEFDEILDSIEPDKNGCMIWPRSPVIYVEGKSYPPSRLSLIRKLGRPLKEKYWALHTCDIHACVSPDHLYEGTPKQNTASLIRRHPNPRSELQLEILRLGREKRLKDLYNPK